jgi:non-specific serine/threonine protein kinase
LVDWSHELLDPPERALFRRLAVFAGGWTLEAAETVCAGGAVAAGRVLDLLTGLIDKSLVVADEGEDGSRYRLLETIRQYAAQKLAEAGEDAAGGEGDALRRRHAAYYRALGQPAAEQAERSHSRRPLEPLRPELGNLWAALRWAIDDGDAPGALRLGLVLGHLVDQFGHLTEARELLAVVLGAAGSADPAARARVLDKAADLAFAQGDYAAAEALRREQMAVAEELGDRGAYAHALNWLGSIARDRGDQAQARARLEESLAICREIGDRHGVALALSRLGTVAHLTGQAARARALYEESAAIWRDRGDDYFRAWSLHSLALLALDEGDPGAARALGLESLALRRAVGDRSGTVYSLALFASLAAAEPARDPHYAERALRLAGAIAALWQGTTAPLMPLYRDHLERWLTVARRTLGAPAAAAADAAGRGMTLAQALDEAVRDAGPM